MIIFPIQPSNLLVTSNVHLVYFISFYLANCFSWMPGASRTHQSHIHRLMAHSAWSLDGANPGAQDPCLQCSLQTHLHYKKHYTLYTSLCARIWLTRNIYIYNIWNVYRYHIYLYTENILEIYFNHLYVASLRQLLLVVQRFVPKKHASSTSQVDPPERFDQYLLHLHDQRCFENPSGSWRTDQECLVDKIYPFWQRNHHGKRGGMVQTLSNFLVVLREKVDMSCHVVPIGEKSLDRWLRDLIWNTPILKFNKKPFRFNKSLWPTPGFLGYFQSSQERKINVRNKECPRFSSCWFNPSEKYESKWVHLPQIGMKITNIWVATT